METTKMKPIRVLVLLGLVIVVIGCQGERFPAVPDELVGIWKTSDAKYSDRFFELKKDVVVFGTGETTVSVHRIASVKRVRTGNQSLYTISYLNESPDKSEWSFYYDAANGPTIQLKNQMHINWTKQGAS